MPILEPVVLEGRGYSIRHVGPRSALFPPPNNSPVAIPDIVVLNQPAMVARDLPMSSTPNSPDMVSGSWSGRVLDAGDFSLVFPNKEASDGQPWRLRFDSAGHNQWIEIRNDGYLELCGCIEKMEARRDQIVISGHDGFFYTKEAYVRDWNCLQAPRDVVERGTQLWMPVIADDFSSGPLMAQWTLATGTGGTGVIQPNGGLLFTCPGGGGNASITSAALAVPSTTQTWSASCHIQQATAATIDIELRITESSGDIYLMTFAGGSSDFSVAGHGVFGTIPKVADSTSYDFFMESDGEFISAYINGQLLGITRRLSAATSTLTTKISASQITTSASALLNDVIVKMLQPYLMRGSDKGDYVLPGTTSTYPTGGLHARYFNNLDIQSDGQRLFKIHSPPRTQAYGGNGTAEYANQQDATINLQANAAGAAGSGWSCIWFGAIYLRLSAGNYSMSITLPGVGSSVVRVWIGKTKFGDQLVDDWASFAATRTDAFTVNAAALTGTQSDGVTVVRDGWYPIKIEYAVDNATLTAPRLFITNSPAAYTDPGGTAIASGAQNTTVPATSLSPLGMVDQRYQGVSHFDMITRALQASGYQATTKPQSLESGLFPGVLAPRIREGSDYDAILEPDEHARAEGLVDYSNVEDASDICTSISGNGAGFQNGSTGQLQANVYDHDHLTSALFDVQAWQDFSDASYGSLLQALLNSQLGLRLDPWQVIAGSPIGRSRIAYTWPLSSALAQMRWRPGDGLFVRARDINVQDSSPRQLLLITREIHPNGTTGTNVGFAARPRSSSHALKQAMFSATRWQRNYQRKLVSLPGNFCQVNVPAGAVSSSGTATNGQSLISIVALMAMDKIVRATVRIANNSGPGSVNILVNGVDQTTTLNGPWTTMPVNLDITSVAGPDTSGQRMYVAIKNNAGSAATDINFQLFVDVLR